MNVYRQCYVIITEALKSIGLFVNVVTMKTISRFIRGLLIASLVFVSIKPLLTVIFETHPPPSATIATKSECPNRLLSQYSSCQSIAWYTLTEISNNAFALTAVLCGFVTFLLTCLFAHRANDAIFRPPIPYPHHAQPFIF